MRVVMVMVVVVARWWLWLAVVVMAVVVVGSCEWLCWEHCVLAAWSGESTHGVHCLRHSPHTYLLTASAVMLGEVWGSK